MPYIKDLKTREALDKGIVFPRNAGELNYCITRSFLTNGNVLNVQDIERCLDNFILAHKVAAKPMKYQDFNDMFGALDCARLEGMRRGWFPLYSSEYEEKSQQKYSKLMQYYYAKYVAPYEDKKIKENGDV